MNTAMVLGWLREFGADLFGAAASVAIVVTHYIRHRAHVRENPTYSIHFVNALTRRAWVEGAMSLPGRDVMAVQTLRNFIMVGILMVSTTTLLLMGTLTLSSQVDSISRSWHALNVLGSHAAGLWIFKVMCLLAVFLVAFFAYAIAVRLANHVVFMLNVPTEFRQAQFELSPMHVANRLNLAGQMMAVGLRALFFAIPLVFWLFGPVFLLAATVGVILIMARLDRHEQGL